MPHKPMNRAALVASAKADHRALEGRVKIQLESWGKRAPVGPGLLAAGGLGAIGRDIARGDGPERGQVGEALARHTLLCHRPLKPSIAFWKPGSRGGANTGIIPNARHSRLMRPTLSANRWPPWNRGALSNCA